MAIRSGYGRAVKRGCAGAAVAACLAAPAEAQEPRGEVQWLDALVVSATATPTTQGKVGSAVTILDAEDLKERQTIIVSDVLRNVPGVAVNRGGAVGQFTQVRIRGSEGNQTLVIIDGIKVNDPSAGSEFNFANLLAADIQRIEVLRGPQSALYGSDAIGGVINIVTRKGEGPPSVGGQIEGGSFGTAYGNVSLGAGSERYNAFASATGFRTDGISVADQRNGNDERDGYRNGTVFAKGSIEATKILRFDGVVRYQAYDGDDDDFFGGSGAVDGDGGYRGEDFFGSGRARLSLFEGQWEHLLGLAYTHYDRDYLDAGVETSNYIGTNRDLTYQTNLFLDTPALAEATHTLTFAYEWQREGVISNSAWSDLDRHIDQHSYIGEYQLGLFDRVFFTGGLRNDQNELFEDATTWRTTLAYLHLETDTKLRGSYGTGVKNPTLFELYGYTNTYQGNPDLKPETAQGWDVGLDQGLFGGLLLAEATYFNQRIEDLIAGSGQTSVNLDGTSRIQGLELGLSVYPIEGLTFRAAYTLTDGVDADGNELVRRPRNMASFNIDYRFLAERADVNLNIVYNGKQKDHAFDAFYNREAVTLDSYTLVNLAGSYRIWNQVELYARVENLLDEDYQEVYSYGSPGIAGYGGLRFAF